jgi:hypothetical protein
MCDCSRKEGKAEQAAASVEENSRRMRLEGGKCMKTTISL